VIIFQLDCFQPLGIKVTRYAVEVSKTNMDRKMDAWTILAAIVTILGFLVMLALLLIGSIDRKFDEKVRDPNFIRKVADEVRLPFVIFDENNKILADSGAYQYLNKINVLRNEKNEVTAIRITPKQFMNAAPIIENINGDLDFSEPERAEEIDWLIRIKPGRALLALESSQEPIKKFKLTIIR
jgi:hypothetical protein